MLLNARKINITQYMAKQTAVGNKDLIIVITNCGPVWLLPCLDIIIELTQNNKPTIAKSTITRFPLS